MSFADEGRPFSFQEVFTDPSQPFDQDLYKAVDELVAEGRISGPSPFDDNVYDEFGRPLNHKTMIYTKAPGRGTPGGGRIDKFRQEVADLPDSRFKDVLLEDIDEVMGLPDDFFDQPGVGTREESLSNIMELYEMQKKQGFPAIKSPVADEDIPTPSFEALQQKLARRSDPNEPKFGDPNKLEMLKEAYRRAAGKKQQMDIARDRVRGSRSPTAQGAPASFPGPEPEGTSRAVRRSPRRERPKKKE
jgi:hypothetical protein